MKSKMKIILSIGVLALFGVFAMASFGSTNIEVQVTKCSAMPAFTGKLTVDVSFRHRDGTGIPNAVGTLFLVHQMIQDTTTCEHLVVSQEVINFVTDIEGNYVYTSPNFTHSNEGDLWRTEVLIPRVEGVYKGGRKVSGALYNTTKINVSIQELDEL
jgi:hypothetical protein